MRTGKELAGLAVVDVRDGKKLGTADEIVVSPDNGRLLGLVMKQGGLFNSDETYVEIEDVRSFGTDAITVEGDEVVHAADDTTEAFREARSGDRSLVGRKVVTQGGTLLGQVSDVLVNEEQRRITALVLGGGMLERGDALPAARVVSVGPDLIVATDSEQEKEERGPFVA